MSKLDPTALEQCRRARTDPNVASFQRVLRSGESSQTPYAYRIVYRVGLVDSLTDHPRTVQRLGGIASTAAGAYQFLSRTWDECAAALGLKDFSPESQDLAAVYLIRRRGALADVLAGRITDALSKCASEWASLPGSPYGQPTISLQSALKTYAQFGGLDKPTTGPATTAPPPPEKSNLGPPGEPAPYRGHVPPLPMQPPAPPPPPAPTESDWQSGRALDPPTAPPKEPPTMAPFIAAGLSALIQNAPALIRVFGDSPQAEKNAKAAEAVAAIAMKATGEATVEGAVKAMEASPEKAAAYREAVHQSMGELLSLMAQAVDIDEKTRATALDRNLTLGTATGGRWLWLLGGTAGAMVLFSFAITWQVLFGEREFSEGVKMLLLGQIVMAGFGLVMAFMFGTNLQNRVSQQNAREQQ